MYEEMRCFCLCHGSAGIFSTVEKLHAKILQNHSSQMPETGEAYAFAFGLRLRLRLRLRLHLRLRLRLRLLWQAASQSEAPREASCRASACWVHAHVPR